MIREHNSSSPYISGSLTLWGAVSMGTGVMIGAGILSLTGQIAELAGTWFPVAFVATAVVAAFSAYSYVRLAHAFPSAGGIAMFLKKAYGRSVMTGACSLLMYFSMVINESLVARTFGTYVLQVLPGEPASWLVPLLGVVLLIGAFGMNLLSNRYIQGFSFFTAFVKIAGLDIAIHWGLLRHLREEVETNLLVLVTAIVLDVVVLAALLWVKLESDALVVWMSAAALVLIFAGERLFLRVHEKSEDDPNYQTSDSD